MMATISASNLDPGALRQFLGRVEKAATALRNSTRTVNASDKKARLPLSSEFLSIRVLTPSGPQDDSVVTIRALRDE